MPVVYTNNTASPITVSGAPTVPAGASIQTSRYLEDHGDLTITQHLDPPWDTKFADEMGNWPEAGLTGLQGHAQLELKNKTGNTVSILVNGNTDKPYVLLDGEVKVFDQNREITSMDADGSGSGNFYVYAIP